MNNADKHITPWSNTDVQKYLKGELSAREMHDLEQLALDDPFLADALEGLQTQPAEALDQDLSELRSRLETRAAGKAAERRKLIAWPFLRVAAAVIILAGIGLIGFYTTHRSAPEAAKTSVVQAPPVVANPPAAQDTAPSVAASEPPPAAKPSARRAIIADKKPQPAEGRLRADYKTTSDSLLFNIHNDTSFLAKTNQDYFPSVDKKSTSFGFKSNLVAFSGRVLDLNHRPLAGASLSYKNDYTGMITATVTDDKGQFSLYVPQKDSTRQLTVALVGYENTQYALNTDDRSGNIIYLRQEPARLDEVVVTGLGAKRKEYIAEPPSDAPEKLDSLWLNTQPDKGRIAYLNYLATAKKTIPVDTAIHGLESISFLVDRKGALTKFRIERSLSPAHDAGVIRLITEGPAWKMVHGRKARALVNVLF